MDKYSYNNKFLTKNNEPYFPVMGEVHYSRINEKRWDETLIKMKSAGVDIVSSYVIWMHHEEVEGEYVFAGNCDLRKFVNKINNHGLKMWLRIGPFVHAEVKNGGFPDWLINKCSDLRSNDPVYIEEITKYLKVIYEQVRGLFYKDGGPIIGIQLENEYGHVGDKGRDECGNHMNTLMQIVKEIGFDVPYYTATGWGGAVIGDCIPVMGGYCEAPWDRSYDKLSPSTNYVITHERDDHKIGNGIKVGSAESYDYRDFPFLTAELGGGLAPTYSRRPIAHPKDISAVAVTKLASGCNLLGFYMYAGGINPQGKTTYLNETRESGSWCDLPEYDYDFFAPIGSYGNINETYKELKLLSLFTKDFGKMLCEMPAYINGLSLEEIMEMDVLNDNPSDLENLRYSIRHNGKSGFLFVNNYVRDYSMKSHLGKEIKIKSYSIDLKFDNLNIYDGDFFFYPFEITIGDLRIIKANATPLCILKDKEEYPDLVVFYGTNSPEFDVVDGYDTDYYYIDREEALNSYKVTLDRDYLVSTKNFISNDGKYISGNDDTLKVYPFNDSLSFEGFEFAYQDGDRAVYELCSNKKTSVSLSVDATENDGIDLVYFGYKKTKTIDYKVHIKYNNFSVSDIENVIISAKYDGNIIRLMVNGKIYNDSFNTGAYFNIGLKEYDYPEEIVLSVVGLSETESMYLETNMNYNLGVACELTEIKAMPIYKY